MAQCGNVVNYKIELVVVISPGTHDCSQL